MHVIFNENGCRNVAESCRKLPKWWYISTPTMAVFCRLKSDFFGVHVFKMCNHLNTRPNINLRNLRNLPIISNISQFISLFFTINSPILPKCCRNFSSVLCLISKHKIYLFLPYGGVHVLFYKQFFYSFVNGCTIKFDYQNKTGIIDVCTLFAILRLPKLNQRRREK